MAGLATVVQSTATVVHSMATVGMAMAVHSMAMVAMAMAVHTTVITAIQAADPTWSVSRVLNACYRVEAKDEGRTRTAIMATTMMMTIMAIIKILIIIPLATVTNTPTTAMAEAITSIEPWPLTTPQKRIRSQETGGSRRW